MANDVDENMKAFLAASTAIRALVGDNICQNKIPQKAIKHYIWLQRATTSYDTTLNDSAGETPRSVSYNVECVSSDLDKAVDIAVAVRNLFPMSGTFGDTTIKGAFANDHSEDYEPVNGDIGFHVEAVQLEICQ